MDKLESLKSVTTKRQLANLLKVHSSFLTYTLYIDQTQKYDTFSIPKRSSGERTIHAPNERIKKLQTKLSNLLLDCIDEINESKKSNDNPSAHISTLSHGFVRGKSIVTNARSHLNRRNVLNLDLNDFFDSFNFGRVRGFFIKNRNFQLNESIATVIAQIACYENALPQGSPCSPVITNLITHSLDIRLAKLAESHSCSYSRYADDLTFSTNKSYFSKSLVKVNQDSVRIGKRLNTEIKRAGFSINHKKTRVQFRNSRQDVTGLIVNKKVNVKSEYWRGVRAKCHKLFNEGHFTEKTNDGEIEGNIYSLEGQLNFIDSIDRYNRLLERAKSVDDFKYQPRTKIVDYLDQLNVREKTFSKFLFYKHFNGNSQPTILTEGKTDPIYLKAAISVLANDYPKLATPKTQSESYKLLVDFFKNSPRTKFLLNLDGGASFLQTFVRQYPFNYRFYKNLKPANPVILVLDNDSGPNSLLNELAGSKKYDLNLSADDIRKKPFTHLIKNLYLILTPLKNGKNHTCMEDFFDSATLSMKLGGKTFNPKNDINTDTTYGKAYFANMVYKKKSQISFDQFKPILNQIEAVLNHFESN